MYFIKLQIFDIQNYGIFYLNFISNLKDITINFNLIKVNLSFNLKILEIIKMLYKNDIKYLVVHCSDTPNTEDLGAIDIHKMHLSFGWNGIGYHKVICKDGKVENGRPEYWVGAHVYGFNNVSLGVCIIGKNNFNQHQLASLENILKSWKQKYPKAKIQGHRDFPNTSKTCPNFDVKKWWLNKIQNEKY